MDRDKVNEENIARDLREQLESSLVAQPAVAMEDEPQKSLVTRVNDAVRYAERQEAWARGKQAIQERERE